MFLGRQGGENVRFAAGRQGDEGITFVNAGFEENLWVAGVAVDDVGVGTLLGKRSAYLAAVVDDGAVEAVAGHVGHAYRYFASPHYQNFLYAALYLAAEGDEVIDVVARGGDVQHVSREHAVVAARNDGLVVAPYGRYVEIASCRGKFLELHSGQGGILADADPDKDNLSFVKFKPVAHP